MYIKEYPDILEHPNTRVWYIRKKIRCKTLFKAVCGDGFEPVDVYYSEGQKRGVMISFIHPNYPERFCLGWSICNSADRWDYIRGTKVENFGKNLAISKAFKFEMQEEIYFPDSIGKLFHTFVESSKKYYKNKSWILMDKYMNYGACFSKPDWTNKEIKHD